MSFLAKIIIDDDTLNVLKCSFSFEQVADRTGRPSQRPRGGQVQLLIESTNRTDFLEWMISPDMKKDGEITFYKRDNMSSLKTIKFTDAYCLNYREDFDAVSDQPLTTMFVLSAKELTVRDTKYINNWPDQA